MNKAIKDMKTRIKENKTKENNRIQIKLNKNGIKADIKDIKSYIDDLIYLKSLKANTIVNISNFSDVCYNLKIGSIKDNTINITLI